MFDEFFQAELWGRHLSIALVDVYARDARFCLILLSDEYVQRAWTTHERRHAISHFISERSDYILCLKIDQIALPGFPSIIGYLSLLRHSEDEVYKLLLQRLGPPNHEGQNKRCAMTRVSRSEASILRSLSNLARSQKV